MPKHLLATLARYPVPAHNLTTTYQAATSQQAKALRQTVSQASDNYQAATSQLAKAFKQTVILDVLCAMSGRRNCGDSEMTTEKLRGLGNDMVK